MISLRTWVALAIALLTAAGAHASGKPWWVDHPFMGDATDIGVLMFMVVRGLLGIDNWVRP